jgi:hypothetical protein
MTAIDMTIPAPARRGRFTKIAAIATLVMALVLALAGTVSLAANAFRDGSGYFNWPTETFTSGGYAIAMKTVDVSKVPQWALNAGVELSECRHRAPARSSSASPAPQTSTATSTEPSTTTSPG